MIVRPKRIPMLSVLDPPDFLGFGGLLVNLFPAHRWHDVVHLPMDDQEGHRRPASKILGRVRVTHEQPCEGLERPQEPNVGCFSPGDASIRQKSSIENEGLEGDLVFEIQDRAMGNVSAQALSIDDQWLGIFVVMNPFDGRVAGHEVRIRGGVPLRNTISRVIENEVVVTHVWKPRKAQKVSRYIFGIAMEENDRSLCRLSFCRKPPAMNTGAFAIRELDLFLNKVNLRRIKELLLRHTRDIKKAGATLATKNNDQE